MYHDLGHLIQQGALSISFRATAWTTRRLLQIKLAIDLLKIFEICIAFVIKLIYNILQKGGNRMEISKETIKRLEKIAEYYSFENDICSIETALQIAINKELEYINEENLKLERKNNETNNNQTR